MECALEVKKVSSISDEIEFLRDCIYFTQNTNIVWPFLVTVVSQTVDAVQVTCFEEEFDLT